MNDLFFLIHSLSANEKRYVTLYINRFSNAKNNYSNLFNTISKHEDCTDEIIIKKHRKEIFVQNLSVTKHYLFKIILDAMREYYDEQFLDWKLRNQLSHIFVLTSKGLDKTAHKMMLKTKEEALLNENYYVYIEIINHERWLYGNRRIIHKDKNYGLLLCEDEKMALDVLTKLNRYKKIWHQLNVIELSYNEMEYHVCIEKLKEIYNAEMKNIQLDSDLYSIKSWHYTCFAHYYMLINDNEGYFKYYKEVTILREKQYAINSTASIDLLATYYNYMLSCYSVKNWSELGLYLEKIQLVETKTIEKKIKLFHDYYLCKLLYCLGKEEYDNTEKILSDIKNGFNIYKDKIRIDFLILIWCYCGLLCFFTKRYNEANTWWQKIICIEKTNLEIRTQCVTYLYLIMLSIEEKNFDILEYQIKNTEKFLKDNKLYSKSEELLLKYFKKISKNKSKQKVYFTDVYHEISNVNKGNLVTIIDDFILKWLNQKLI